MTFEELLRQLHGLVGRPVAVTIAGVDGPPVAAHIVGTLKATSDVTSDYISHGSTEALWFHVGDEIGNGFFLHSEYFAAADWKGEVLAVIVGSIMIAIALDV
jgi:hypothetical protein